MQRKRKKQFSPPPQRKRRRLLVPYSDSEDGSVEVSADGSAEASWSESGSESDDEDYVRMDEYEASQAKIACQEAGAPVGGKRCALRSFESVWYLDDELGDDGHLLRPPAKAMPVVEDTAHADDDPDQAEPKKRSNEGFAERITSIRRDASTKEVSVRVKWCDYDVCESTWEPFEYMCKQAPIPVARYCVNLIAKDPEFQAAHIETALRTFCRAAVVHAFDD